MYRDALETEKQIEETEENDSQLVSSARSGDQEAFSELVRRHRARAFGIARILMKDPHLAEDIVQDALIRAFMNLGKLYDPQRFVPWFNQIVRNQAMMKLRRGGLYRKEQPFTSLLTQPTGKSDWDSLEQIIVRMKSLVIRENEDNYKDPIEIIIRQEFLDMIHSLLHCLNQRERSIFEAYFFKQLPPEEIANLFDTSRSYIYKTISVAKQKVQGEHLRVYLENHIQIRKDAGLMGKTLLKKPDLVGSQEVSLASCNHCFLHTLHYYPNFNYSLIDIAGFTGHSFRTTIERFTVDVSGPGFYDWSSVFKQGLSNIGVEAKFVDRPQYHAQVPELLADSLNLIHTSINQGTPALVWDLLNLEFSLIYGYDDERQLLYAMDTKNDTTVPYQKLGRGKHAELFVIAFTQFHEVDLLTRLKDSLKMIIGHARGKELGYPEFAYGLSAYGIWKQLYKERKIDPLGNAFSLLYIKEAREFGVSFLNELADKKNIILHLKLRQLIQQAALYFSAVIEALEQLCFMFPSPSGGDPNEDEAAEAAIKLLNDVEINEEAGICLMEQMLDEILLCI